MNGRPLLVGLAVALATVVVACTGESPPAPPSPPPPVRLPGVPVGGVLRTQIVSDVSAAFDPQREYYSLTFELFRCCLLRTLLATNGQDPRNGGLELHPDLAASMPTVSADGLVWTFRLRPNIHYAPPLQNLTVTAQDFIRALEREACRDCSTGGYAFYYSVIEGFDAAYSGEAKTIVGLTAPEPLTLLVRLNRPAGDLGYRFALGATAPIPPKPANPAATLGVATGHTEDYGRFLATTGPYMFRGQQGLAYTASGEDEIPIAGYRPGISITLVRNPSWKSSTDDLRPAYVDEIDIGIGGTREDVTRRISIGTLDIGPDTNSILPPDYGPNPPPPNLHMYQTDTIRYFSFNLAIPPFDDVHVRRAVSYAIDKEEMLRLATAAAARRIGSIATHAFPDSVEMVGGHALLSGFDPYATRDHAGDLAKARAEMKLSKYDSNGDGICDARACSRVRAFTVFDDPYAEQTGTITRSLDALGIHLGFPTAGYLGAGGAIDFCRLPWYHLALCLSEEWTGDYPDVYAWWAALSSGGLLSDEPNRQPGSSGSNTSLLGASPEFLSQNHYPKFLRTLGSTVTSVPSVDADFDRCEPLTGDQRVRCWADLDRKLMTEIVPWVPYLIENRVTLTSERLRNFTWDAFTGVASLDHLAVLGETTG